MVKSVKVSLFAAAVLAAAAGAVHAQGYPSKPVKIIVPFGAGGPADIYARVIAQRLAAPLGQQVVVEDRPGAGSAIGTDVAAKSAPDGNTLLMISNTHTINETLNPKLPYNLMRDFAPITQVNVMPNVLVVSPTARVNSVKELIAPRGTAAAVIDRLHDETAKILRTPDVQASFQQQGVEPAGTTPAQFAAFLKNEVERWGKVVKFSGAKVE
ncbi:MAG: hypothetical protein A3G29_08680 [Burkholderiales bacterium RIFCSPLOWO2_12_FULL_64_99]|nr:MAG: hypothetical protein A3G29_08680 [Burkholderiales bacterium RIFCSPLOWO2_12_FULL_64_99]